MTITTQEEQVYPYTFKFQGKKNTLLWVTSSTGSDHFKLTKDKTLFCANNISDAKKKFVVLPFDIIWREAATIDFDKFWRELNKLHERNPTNKKVCKIILDGWNFIEDLLRTFSLDDLREKLNDLQINKAYKKFFWGCNIEAVTPKGSGYEPLWEKDELFIIRERLGYVWKKIGQETKLW